MISLDIQKVLPFKSLWKLLFLLSLFFGSSYANDLDSLNLRLRSVAFLPDQSESMIDSLMTLMDSSGRFPDLVYAPGDPNNIRKHMSRLQILASAFVDSNNTYFGDSVLGTQILQGIQLWVDLNIHEPNWWHRTINYPKRFWPSVILMRDYLEVNDPILLVECSEYLTWGWDTALDGYKTGANLTDILQGHIPGALLINSSEAISAGMAALEDDLEFSEGDGIHRDFSYSQHSGSGLQLYMGGYGNVYADGVTQIFEWVKGLEWIVSEDALLRFEGFLFSGVQWATWGSVMDYSVMGRSIGREGSSRIGSAYKWSIRRFAAMRRHRQLEADQWIQRMDDGVDGTGPLGSQVFWRQDYLVHRESDWMASVRMTSTRTVGSESGNGEALMNYHMGDGAYFIYRNGDEYEDIFPVWDWHRIPGITTRQHGDDFPLSTWGKGGVGASHFAGGVNSSVSSAIGFVYDRESVQAHKSWFTFPGKMIALGAGIQSDLNDSPIYTSIQQSKYHSTPLFAANGGDDQWVDHSGSASGTALIWHDSIAYHVLDSAQIEIRVAEQEGSWNRINSNLSTSPVQDSVFSIWLDHGNNPNGGDYAYAIYPHISLADAREREQRPHLKILANHRKIQAVYDSTSNTLAAVFYEPSTLWLNESKRIYSSIPQALLLEESIDSTVIHVSNPDQSASILRFFISEEWQGEGVLEYRDSINQTVVQVPAPDGMMAGSSVQITLYPVRETTTSINQTNGTESVVISEGQLRFFSNNTSTESLKVRDLNGRVLMNQEVDLVQGVNIFEIPSSSHPIIIEIDGVIPAQLHHP